MIEEAIYVREEDEVCLYCPMCGKKTLFLNAEKENNYRCCSCEQEFIMKGIEE